MTEGNIFMGVGREGGMGGGGRLLAGRMDLEQKMTEEEFNFTTGSEPVEVWVSELKINITVKYTSGLDGKGNDPDLQLLNLA